MIDNTSFNVRGEPIVCTPDAFRCFIGSEIETLVVGNCILDMDEQDPKLKLDYKDKFELDLALSPRPPPAHDREGWATPSVGQLRANCEQP